MASTGGAPAIGLIAAWLMSAAPASAQEPRIFVDPDSPAGQEYQIPLDRARQQAMGDAGEKASGLRSPRSPLFGIGIDKAGDNSDDARGGGGRGARGADGSGPRTAGAEGERPPEGGEIREGGTAAIEAASGGGSTGLITAGIATGMLALGLALGFGLRRLLRD